MIVADSGRLIALARLELSLLPAHFVVPEAAFFLVAGHKAGHVGALTTFGYRLSPELIRGALDRTGER